jgi:hypothetical protein
MWPRVSVGRIDVSEEHVASIFRAERISLVRKDVSVEPAASIFRGEIA